MSRPLSLTEAMAVYSVLVSKAKAVDTPDNRRDFAYALGSRETTEYRFMGNLGFGGKFWNNNDRWYVTAYSEDTTPERQSIIDEVNEELEELRKGYCG